MTTEGIINTLCYVTENPLYNNHQFHSVNWDWWKERREMYDSRKKKKTNTYKIARMHLNVKHSIFNNQQLWQLDFNFVCMSVSFLFPLRCSWVMPKELSLPPVLCVAHPRARTYEQFSVQLLSNVDQYHHYHFLSVHVLGQTLCGNPDYFGAVTHERRGKGREKGETSATRAKKVGPGLLRCTCKQDRLFSLGVVSYLSWNCLDGIRPARGLASPSCLACHQVGSSWLMIWRMEPFLKASPASLHGMALSSLGLKSKNAFRNTWMHDDRQGRKQRSTSRAQQKKGTAIWHQQITVILAGSGHSPPKLGMINLEKA